VIKMLGEKIWKKKDERRKRGKQEQKRGKQKVKRKREVNQE